MSEQHLKSPDLDLGNTQVDANHQSRFETSLMSLQVKDRLGDYVSDMLKFLGQNLVSDNRLLKTVSLHVNASTGDIDLEVTDEEQISQQHLLVSQENEDCLRQSRLEANRARIRQGRAKLASGNWSEALELLRKVENDLERNSDSDILRALQRMIFEVAHYIERREWRSKLQQEELSPISQRIPCELNERHWMQPQTIFILSSNGRTWLGRKLVSDEWIAGRISELFCSKITPEMLLGELVSSRTTQDSVVAYYRPATSDECKAFMDEAVTSKVAELRFPFVHLTRGEKLEVVSPLNGWSVDDSMRDQLFNGEAALRKYTAQALKGYVPSGALLYDPACSTGDFLSSVQQAFPGTRSFGQDLSAEMIQFARTQLDETYVGDAINSPLANESVDVAFVRFLNSEVVSTEYATNLFDEILVRIKPEGLLVVFGHTPVLLDSGFFENRKLTCLEKIGQLETGEIFQFYLLRKTRG
jgi:hypothetical protein